MKSYTRIRARIDLDAIEYNIEKMKENLPEDTKLMDTGLCRPQVFSR